VQSHSILNFLLSVLPPVKHNASFSALENIPQATFIAVCRFYIVTVRKPIDANFGKKNQFGGMLVSFAKVLLS